jgi:GNAT superfamily N-acetyltransferase
MAWRATGKEAKATDRISRKAAMQRRVSCGTPVGILGYRDGEPVAWCSIAPRETYRDLGGAPAKAGEVVWSLVCFFLRRDLRHGGVAPALLAAAVDHARSRGATVVEAYPVDPDSPSYRFGGFVSMFEAAGFTEAGRAGSRRHVMRLSLTPRRSTRRGSS